MECRGRTLDVEARYSLNEWHRGCNSGGTVECYTLHPVIYVCGVGRFLFVKKSGSCTITAMRQYRKFEKENGYHECNIKR
ncbi:MAG: hypothetical protein PHG02_05195 [Oscillospiraceae bacterium]|nr:hypothetical protein [Oscillospiraceae bacterium]